MGKPTVIDLFCGAGGLSEGFREAGYKVLLGIDNIERYIESFKKNHSKSRTICDDIRKISVKKIKEIIGNKKVDVIVGGPPCQGFSMAGRRDPQDPRNSLFMDFVRIVKGVQPEYFVMENVRGMLSTKNAKGRPVVEIIKEEFKKINYKVKEDVLLAADYGVPQKRHRLIFIGTKPSNPVTFPPRMYKNPKGKKQFNLFDLSLADWVPVDNVLLDRDKVDKSFFHSPKMIEGFIKRKQRHTASGNGFGWQILKDDKPSYTISARYWKDGADALVKYSDTEIRMLTPLECARIQTFPDTFKFTGSKKEVYIQIGNAVPPLLAKAIAEEIKRHLKK